MSLKYIADKAGVSTTTVSNVVNRRGHVSPQVAEKVRGVIQDEDITLTHRKRKRSARTRRHVALVSVGEILLPATGVFHCKLFKGMRSVLRTRGYSLLMPSGTMPDEVYAAIQRADALILAGSGVDVEMFADTVPFPALWLLQEGPAAHDAVIDNSREAGRLAAEYLFGKGHRLVGCIEDESVAFPDEKGMFFSRFMEYFGGKVIVASWKEACLPLAWSDESDLEGLRGVVAMLLAGTERITALFLPCNRLFAPVSALLKEMAVHPGDDIEILSCIATASEIWAMRGCSAAINVNLEDIGKRAAECVFWRLDNPNEAPIRISVCPRLVTIDDAGLVRPMA